MITTDNDVVSIIRTASTAGPDTKNVPSRKGWITLGEQAKICYCREAYLYWNAFSKAKSLSAHTLHNYRLNPEQEYTNSSLYLFKNIREGAVAITNCKLLLFPNFQ